MALKVKYSRDEMSGHIVDIIHAGMCTDFVYANDGSIGSNFGHMARVLLPNKGTSYASHYETVRRAAERNLQKIIDKKDSKLNAWVEYNGMSYDATSHAGNEMSIYDHEVNVDLNFNRLKGVKSMSVAAGQYHYDETAGKGVYEQQSKATLQKSF